MVQTTRTLNPLPLEHLEPKRFEDLVRQLAYDFRKWRSLEATGRSGSDDGYDVRGWEIVSDSDFSSEDREEDNDDESVEYQEDSEDRKWLFQCKREQKITPAKLKVYLEEIPETERNGLYGVVFATSSDISKKSRDLFIETCGSFGISECFIWSRAEIEDMLFQPKNDGLLFAYFGISLRIKQRSIRTQLRSRLTIKRKVYAALGGTDLINQDALFLDPEDKKYPYTYEGEPRNDHYWHTLNVKEHHPLGIWVERHCFIAYLDDDGERWDIANVYNKVSDNSWNDSWAIGVDKKKEDELSNEIDVLAKDIGQKNIGNLMVDRLVSYEDIIDVDKTGDVWSKNPILFVTYKDRDIPAIHTRARLIVPPIYDFPPNGRSVLLAESRELFDPDPANRIKIFPHKYRKEIKGKKES